jgi:hypothetical protein
MLIYHHLRVDQPCWLDDLEVLAGKPHLRRAKCHTDASMTTRSNIELGDRHRCTDWPYHALKETGFVHIFHTTSIGASNTRSNTTES